MVTKGSSKNILNQQKKSERECLEYNSEFENKKQNLVNLSQTNEDPGPGEKFLMGRVCEQGIDGKPEEEMDQIEKNFWKMPQCSEQNMP